MATENSAPCSLNVINIVEMNIAGNIEKIPLSVGFMFDRSTDMAIITPAVIPLNIIFFGV